MLNGLCCRVPSRLSVLCIRILESLLDIYLKILWVWSHIALGLLSHMYTVGIVQLLKMSCH